MEDSRLAISTEKLPLSDAMAPPKYTVLVKELSEVPYAIQAACGAVDVFTPVNEADRVVPVALTLLAEPVVTVALLPPEVPPPDSLQLLV